MRKLQVSLPHERGEALALEVAKEIVEALQEFGVPVTGAVHRPPEGGDDRNFHLHCAYYDRKATLMPDGRWDFQHQAQRLRDDPAARIKLQPKNKELCHIFFATRMRQLVIEIANRAYKRAGVPRVRWVQSFAAAGVKQKPIKQPPRIAFRQEQRGIVRPEGRAAALDFARRRVAEIWQTRIDHVRKARDLVDSLRLWNVPKKDPECAGLRAAAAEFLRLERWTAAYRERRELITLRSAALDPLYLRQKVVDKRLASKKTSDRDREKLASERADLEARLSIERRNRLAAILQLDMLQAHPAKIRRRVNELTHVFHQVVWISPMFRKHGRMVRIVAAELTIMRKRQAERTAATSHRNWSNNFGQPGHPPVR